MTDPFVTIKIRMRRSLLEDIDQIANGFQLSRNKGIVRCLSSSMLQSVLAGEKARALQKQKQEEEKLQALRNKGRALQAAPKPDEASKRLLKKHVEERRAAKRAPR